MLLISIICYYYRANRSSLRARLVIRIYSNYILLRVICEISSEIDACVKYYRYNRRYNLIPNDTEIQKQFAAKKKLDGEIKETETKTARLYK
jgi:hypothetical protein